MSEPTSPDCCACGCVNETRESRKSEWIYWTCGGWQHIDSGKFGVSGIENRGTHMALIRSLREELAEVRGLAISMAYELKCSFTDMDCDGECANAGCGSCYPCKLHVQAKALRNNEHRSDT